MKCPICKKDVSPDNSERPFCSERCRIIDLANWASDRYVIPDRPVEGNEENEKDEG